MCSTKEWSSEKSSSLYFHPSLPEIKTMFHNTHNTKHKTHTTQHNTQHNTTHTTKQSKKQNATQHNTRTWKISQFCKVIKSDKPWNEELSPSRSNQPSFCLKANRIVESLNFEMEPPPLSSSSTAFSTF